MKNKEFNQMNKEIDEWNKFKEEIKEKVNMVSIDNYDENSLIFRILKIDKKKDKNSFIKLIASAEEGIFLTTFSVMNDYYEEKINKKYIKIENIPSLEDVFGILDDRINSNEEMIKFSKKELLKHKKEIDKINDYDKRKEIESKVWWDEYNLKSYEKEINFYNHIKSCIKSDVKSEIGRERRKKSKLKKVKK